ncbi:MAG: pantoate--beta-alanine ligase [Actinobacteria bacterium]|uniref:pantoate--beta-alanine ligase (AMP-forming) n=1 Tax=freshwater metagenome TaxID=449393 RepID=A0A6J6R001_9ZZZZ|nr:pantoate--beta-alanine ligase [Actinomycetota bacterium]MSW76496.1 pantoate--beta-alanine ligase [Actinomycetota bacterium]MSX55582.1 pantoate--beta-alanine ligase [Actinomycetota bacterium]MSX93891.1 pantoate--beta-alanine ligase [Actinomycetota bacterium]MSZ82384.1 pantoate--beta-alanine ligase [Actinomycetota bacterium]
MYVITTPVAMSAWSDAHRVAGRRVVLVPTMGALHEGHLALVDEARRHADVVALSIFVNPLQFNRPDDFTAYPRPIDDDLSVCRSHGVDAVYVPTAADMYPAGFETHVEPGALANILEGAQRPGHFRGVTTVVAKLFGAARPHVAVFGQKDFQQLAIIQRMTIDLDMGIEIIGMPTVREADGLALSSRNRRLTSAQRTAATCVPRALDRIAEACSAGERDTDRLIELARSVVDAEPLARFEHLEIVHPDTLQSLDTITDRAVAVTAVWFDEVRLIDNQVLSV